MKEQYQPLEFNIVKDAVARHCAFSLGRIKIQQTQPVFDEWIIKRELERTKEAYALVIRYGSMPFSGVSDIEEQVISAAKDRTLLPRDLYQIANQIRACANVQKYVKESEVKAPAIQELCDSLGVETSLASAIESCISNAYEVMDNASSELKGIRKSIRICEGDIAKEVQQFISRHGASLMDTITTKRNGRICVLVKISEKNTLKGFIHGESASGQTAYLEPESLLLLNNRLQSLHSKEADEIERILYSLSQQVKQHKDILLGNLDTFVILDALFAKALWCKEVDGCIPEVKPLGNRFYMKDARHPLIDPKHVVANTYELKDPKKMMIITGSNTGGKTVTLKTMGLFVALAMAGMPVSAQEAIFPLFDQLFVDIGDDQSIQESLSTFSAHMSKLANICEQATSRSFIVLDELGSGTDPKEGEALAIGILESLRNKQVMCVASTHYSALKKYGAAHDDVLLSSVAFDLETMKPTYKFLEGIGGQSNAFEIASRYGLPQHIIETARNFKEQQKSESDRLMETMEETIVKNHQLKEKMELRLEDIKQLQISLEKQKQQFANEKEHELQKLKETIQQEYLEKMEEAELIINELKSMSKDVKPHEYTKLKKELQTSLQTTEEEVEESQHVYEIGDYVLLKEYQYYGDIISMNKEKATVNVNGMKMKIPFHQLQVAKKPTKTKKEASYQKSIVSSFSMELNVIGMTVNEATPVIDKYLDNAVIAKVFQVRIVHGNGTGALRQGVHTFLKRNPRVESYRVGGQGEGGLGATVVTLKQKVKKNG